MGDLGVNEFGIEGEVAQRFWNGDEEDPRGLLEGNTVSDCELAFKNYMCFMNFPRCDEEKKSLILCRSVCENFFRACKYPFDLWRCGPSIYQNAYEPEIPTLNEETGEYNVFWREFFPGQPFRDNEFDDLTDDPIVVCTPSLLAAAPLAKTRSLWAVLLSFAGIALCTRTVESLL